jgi:hypothetical protein
MIGNVFDAAPWENPAVRLLLPILLFSFPSLLPAAEIYVATTGNDSTGNGTIGAPFASIQRALNAASPGDTVIVRPGLYNGRQRLEGEFDPEVRVISEVPYQARLRHSQTVVTCYGCQGITLEGFDIAHSGPGASALVVQVANPGTERVRIVNNVLHDSYNNDILKINNGARHVEVRGNLFYNHGDSDEHIDINSVEHVTVEDNIFMSDFPGSGRSITGNASSYIVVKDSNGDDDGIVTARHVIVARNVFLNWQGGPGSNFVLCGEDGHPYYEAADVLIENNLLLGNSAVQMRSPFGVKGSRDITVRHNTVVGDLPSAEYALRCNTEGDNQPCDNILFANNIWSDPTGTMTRFALGPNGEVTNWTLHNNLVWNNGNAIPHYASSIINVTNDAARILADPQLPSPSGIVLPRWNPASEGGNDLFADGSSTIAEAWHHLVTTYGIPGPGSAALNAADPLHAPATDMLGTSRGSSPSVGALEIPAVGERDAWVVW